MKILLVNAYLRNTGDAALSSVLISELRRVWPSADITVSSVEEPSDWPTFEGCENIGSIRLYAGLLHGNKIRRVLRKLLVLAVEATWGHLPAAPRAVLTRHLPRMVRVELQRLEAADIVISTAGGYLNGPGSLGGDLSVRYMLLPLKLAAAIGKPVLLAPQSYGAFGTRRQEKAVRQVLSKTQCIMTRESKSLELLGALGIPKKLLAQAVDVAFAFDHRLGIQRPSRTGRERMKIGVTTRSWSSPAQQRAYEQALADFIGTVETRYGAEVVLISHVTRDVYSEDGSAVDKSIAALVKRAGGQAAVIDTLADPHEMKKIYDGLDYIVGTRFHSVIFSLTSFVPAIAIEYQHKTSGIMRDLGLSDWVVNFEDVSAEGLLTLFDRLMSEKAAYERHLHKVLPAYVEKANETGTTLKQAYERWLGTADAAGQEPQS